MQEGDDMLVHINTVKALADQLRSIEVNITDEDVYMVLLMSLPPSFDNLVTSLESMSTKDVHHKLAPSLYECFYNTLTICSTFNVDTIIDMMLR